MRATGVAVIAISGVLGILPAITDVWTPTSGALPIQATVQVHSGALVPNLPLPGIRPREKGLLQGEAAGIGAQTLTLTEEGGTAYAVRVRGETRIRDAAGVAMSMQDLRPKDVLVIEGGIYGNSINAEDIRNTSR